jgi:hypothetical protein
MEKLIEKLNNYFLKNETLESFLSTFKEMLPELTKELLVDEKQISGFYLRDRLFLNDKFEVILITWGSDCKTRIHKHPHNGCLLSIMEGTLVEERYDNNKELFQKDTLKNGDIGYMHNDIGRHRIINNNDHNVYSLHIYSPPRFYDLIK